MHAFFRCQSEQKNLVQNVGFKIRVKIYQKSATRNLYNPKKGKSCEASLYNLVFFRLSVAVKPPPKSQSTLLLWASSSKAQIYSFIVVAENQKVGMSFSQSLLLIKVLYKF